MNKILLVNKDKDMTSRDVVNKLCKIFKTKKMWILKYNVMYIYVGIAILIITCIIKNIIKFMR